MSTMQSAVTLLHRVSQYDKLLDTSIASGDALQAKDIKLLNIFGGTSGIILQGDDGDSAKTLVKVSGTTNNVAGDKLFYVEDDASANLFHIQEDGDAYLKKNFEIDGDLQIDGTGTSTFAGNLTVTGNLQVDGTTTTINTTQLDVEDQIIRVAKAQTGVPSLDAGISVERGDSNNALCVFDESVDEWVLGYTPDDTAAQVTFSSLADMRANEGNFEGGLILTNTGLTATGLDLGGSGSRLGTVYCATLDATSITGTIISTGTNNLSWTVNEDADSATNEDAAWILKSGDGVNAPLSATVTYVNPDGTVGNSYIKWDRLLDAQSSLKVSGGSLDVDVSSDFSATPVISGTAGLTISGSGAMNQSGTGQVTFSGNVDADAGLDVSGGALTIANQAITQTTGGQVTFAGNVDAGGGLDVSGAAQTFTGTAGSWTTALSDSALTQTGSGLVTLTGNVDATNGLDVSGAALTIANQAITQTTGGQVTFAGNVDADGGLDVVGNLTHASGGTGNIDVAWDFSGGLTNSSGELLVSGGNFQLNDDISLSFGTDDDATLQYISATDDLKLASKNVTAANSTEVIIATGTTTTMGNSGDITLETGSAAETAGTIYAKTNGTVRLTMVDASSTFAHNLNADAGLDVSGGALTIANQAITQTAGGQVTFAGNVDANGGLDVSGALTADAGVTLTNTGVTATGLDFGGSGARLGTVYCNTLDATNIIGDTTADGTDSNYFSINEDAAATEVEDAWTALLAGRGAGGTTIQEARWRLDHNATGSAGSYIGDIIFEYASDNAGLYTTTLTISPGSKIDSALNFNALAGLDVSGGALTITNQAITQTTGGQVTFAGNVDAGGGLDVSGAAQTFTGTAGSWTTALSDSALTQTGSGLVTLTGNVDATNGLDVSGAALTIANQAITQTTGGQVTFAGNVDATNGLDVTTAALTADAGLTLTTSGITMTGLDVASSGNRAGTGYFTTLDATYLNQPWLYRTLTNSSGVAVIPSGTPVYIDGDGTVWKCDASSSASSDFIGVTLEELAISGSGKVAFLAANVTVKKAAGEAWAGGDRIYLSEVEGEFTKNAPTTSGSFVKPVGRAVTSKAAGLDGDMIIDILGKVQNA